MPEHDGYQGDHWLKEDLQKYKLGIAITLINTFVEDIILLPLFQYALVNLNKIQAIVFGKFLSHITYVCV